MAVYAREILKRWFGRGCYPTAGQFASVFDSFYHKGEKLPPEAVPEIAKALNDKFDRRTGERLERTTKNLGETFRDLAETFEFLAGVYDELKNEGSLGIVDMLSKLRSDFDALDYQITNDTLPNIEYNRAHIDTLEDSVGQPERDVTDGSVTRRVPGIAPLDERGTVPPRFLPSFVDDAIDFDGFAPEDMIFEEGAFAGTVTSNSMSLLFDRASGCFVLEVRRTPGGSDAEQGATRYYTEWEPTEQTLLGLGQRTPRGFLPLKGKSYYLPSENKSYRWSGSSLAPVGSDLALGHTDRTAFPGDEGKRLAEEVGDHEGWIDGMRAVLSEPLSEELDIRAFIEEVAREQIALAFPEKFPAASGTGTGTDTPDAGTEPGSDGTTETTEPTE